MYLKRPLSCPRIKHADLLRALTTDASDSVGFGSILEVPLEARRESGGFGCHGNANKSSLSKTSSRCNMVLNELYHLVPWLQQHQISLEVLHMRLQHRGPIVSSSKSRGGPVEPQDSHAKILATTSTTSSGATSRHRSIFMSPIRGSNTLLHSSTRSPLSRFNSLLLDWSTPHVVYLNPTWHLLPQSGVAQDESSQQKE
jgi:hypothetical protein